VAESNLPRAALWSALVVQGALERRLLPEFTAQSGIGIDTVFDPTAVLMNRLKNEGLPDVIISTSDSLHQLQAVGFSFERVAPLVRSAIGIGVAPGSALRPPATSKELVKILVNARSVAYSRTGQSGIYFVELLDRLGIREIVDSRATVIEKGFTGNAVADGRADVAIQQLSELAFVDGVATLGPLPSDIQHYTEFSIGLAQGNGQATAPAAVALTDFLTAPPARHVFASYGLLPDHQVGGAIAEPPRQ
jgi:molybdate transport system substrate-binding protein